MTQTNPPYHYVVPSHVDNVAHVVETERRNKTCAEPESENLIPCM